MECIQSFYVFSNKISFQQFCYFLKFELKNSFLFFSGIQMLRETERNRKPIFFEGGRAALVQFVNLAFDTFFNGPFLYLPNLNE